MEEIRRKQFTLAGIVLLGPHHVDRPGEGAQERLPFGTWNFTSLLGKEPDLVHEVEIYRLDLAHLNARPGLWNQSYEERLDSVLVWSCP